MTDKNIETCLGVLFVWGLIGWFFLLLDVIIKIGS